MAHVAEMTDARNRMNEINRDARELAEHKEVYEMVRDELRPILRRTDLLVKQQNQDEAYMPGIISPAALELDKIRPLRLFLIDLLHSTRSAMAEIEDRMSA